MPLAAAAMRPRGVGASVSRFLLLGLAAGLLAVAPTPSHARTWEYGSWMNRTLSVTGDGEGGLYFLSLEDAYQWGINLDLQRFSSEGELLACGRLLTDVGFYGNVVNLPGHGPVVAMRTGMSGAVMLMSLSPDMKARRAGRYQPLTLRGADYCGLAATAAGGLALLSFDSQSARTEIVTLDPDANWIGGAVLSVADLRPAQGSVPPPQHFTATEDGGFVVQLVTNAEPNATTLVHVDASLDVTWTAKLVFGAQVRFQSIQRASGATLLAGSIMGAGIWDALTCRIEDPGLAVTCTAAHSSAGAALGDDAVQADDGGVVSVGRIVTTGTNDRLTFTLQMSANLTPLRQTSLGDLFSAGWFTHLAAVPGGIGFSGSAALEPCAPPCNTRAWMALLNNEGRMPDTCKPEGDPQLILRTEIPVLSNPTVTATPTSGVISDLAGAPAGYDFRGLASPIWSAGGDAWEPDDSCLASGNALRDGESQPHTFCDDPSDWLRFNAAAGVTYTIETSALESAADTVLELHDRDGTVLLASDDNGGGGLASRIDWVTPDPATFAVRVRQRDGTTGPGRGYTISLSGAGPPFSSWLRSYARDTSFRPTALAAARGSVLAAGFTGATRAIPATETHVVKLTESGVVEWEERLEQPMPLLTKAISCSSGGWALAGHDTSAPHAVRVVRMRDDGSILWSTRVMGPGNSKNLPVALLDMPDGSIVVGDGLDRGPAWLARLDPVGDIVWQKLVQGGTADHCADVVSTPEGLAVLLAPDPSASGQHLVNLLRLDGAADLLGASSFDLLDATSSLAPVPTALVRTSDGSLFVTVTHDFERWPALPGHVLGVSSVVKLTSAGQVVFAREYAADLRTGFAAAVATGDGGIRVAGLADFAFGQDVDGMQQVDALVACIGADGTPGWAKGYGPWPRGDVILALAEAPAGGSYLAGNVGLADTPDVLHGWIARAGADGALPRGCQSTRDIPLVPRALAVAEIDAPFTVTDATLAVDHPAVTVTPVSLAAVSSCAGNLAPGEVSGASSAFPLRVAPTGLIEWEPGQFNGALTFNLYRGDLMRVGRDGGPACLQSGLALPSTTDLDALPGSGGWYYLVAGSNEEGEGPLGFDSQRKRTSPGAACR